jgi:GNAT superfamily N-acetyltransferase
VEVAVRPLRSDEIPTAASLIARVFDRDIAPLYRAEGVREFLSYASPESLARKMRADLAILVAEDAAGAMVGLVGFRDHSHISLLFVEENRQRRGIGRQLVDAAVRACKEADPSLTDLTVNASPNSVKAYESLGFVAEGSEQEMNGIRFVPMRLSVG